MKLKSVYFILPVLTCCFLTLGWNPHFSPLFLFIAFVPLLLFEELTKTNNILTFLSVSYVCLVVWNFMTTNWIFSINETGGVLISLINPLFFAVPILGYRIVKKTYGFIMAGISFICLWLSIEYFHHNWELAFPYLTLGYPLAKYPWMIQWYEFTGVLGGTSWILLCNLTLVGIIRAIIFKRSLVLMSSSFLFVLIPSIVSAVLFYKEEDKGQEVKFLILHSNADCYSMKYVTNPRDLLKHYLEYTIPAIKFDTEYILWPETAITGKLMYQDIRNDTDIKWLKDTLSHYTKATLITGAFVNERVNFNPFIADPSDYPYLKYNKEHRLFYHSYNAAIQISKDDARIPVHTKKRLVPIEETTPYPKVLFFVRKYIKSFGGFGFTSKDDEANVFSSGSGKVHVAPLICYESLFGEDVTEYVRQGANIIVVMLNEGWYKNPVAATHFVNFSKVRAIENRRWVARSSNDGISCFIDQKGSVIDKLTEFKPGILKATLETNDQLTFYSRHGDYLGRISFYLSLIVTPLFIVFRKKGLTLR